MRALRALWLRLAATLRPSRHERELAEELDSHLQLHIDDCIRRGMSPEEARREARLRLGGVAQTQESVRARRRLPGVESLVADLRFGLRLLRRSPGFAAVAILTLALGIGASASMFSIVRAVLWSPLPYPQPSELVLVSEAADGGGRATTTSFATWADWRARSRSFEELALLRSWQPTLGGSGSAEQIVAARVTVNFFRALGVAPALGRDFQAAEDTPSTRRVVILGHDLWRRRFDADPGIVGRTVTVDGDAFTVVGVLPSDFDPLATEATLGQAAQLWAPVGYQAADPWACRTCRHVFAVGRLAPGVTRESARAELGALTGALAAEYPGNYSSTAGAVVPMAEQLVGSARSALYLLLGAVGVLWLIACVNATLLLLARASHREREVAVRMALGAGRARIVRQLLCENSVLALLGAAAGLVPAYFLPQVLAALGPRVIPRLAEVGVDGGVLLFAFGLALASGILSGVVPALRLASSRLPATLRDGARSSAAAPGRRLRSWLVVAQVALSLTLLVGAGLMVRSLSRLLDVAPGFEPDRVLTMRVSLVGPAYESDAAVRRYFDDVLARLSALPGVEASAMASQVPLGGNYDTSGFHAEGRMAPNPENDPSAQRFGVSPDYLRLMRIPLVRGRGLARSDVDGAPRAILVNQTAARQVWGDADPIGQRVKLGGTDEPWWTVVGVVGDVRHLGLDAPPEMQAYVPHAQWRAESAMILTLRTTGPPLDLAAAAERAVRSIDPAQAVSQVTALEQFLTASVARRRFALILLAVFAGLALLLSAIGIYGVTSYAVARRTHEIGIRLALGARPPRLLASIVGRGIALTLAGIAVGAAVSLALSRTIAAHLHGVSATDPVTFAAVSGLLIAVAAAACYVPARRVLAVEPTEALRSE